MFGESCICFFNGNFNRIDEIARGFPSQVDFRKLSNIMCKLRMLQKVPTRRSPNLFIYKLKCTKSANVVSTLSKWGLTRPSKIMVPWKWWSSKYVVFPERQPYFTEWNKDKWLSLFHSVTKWCLMRPSKLMVASKRRSSSHVVLGQHKSRIGTVNCPYSWGAIWARIHA